MSIVMWMLLLALGFAVGAVVAWVLARRASPNVGIVAVRDRVSGDMLSDALDSLADQWFASRLRIASGNSRPQDTAAMLVISADHFTDL